MARLSAHGKELFRYLSPKYRALVAVYADGTILKRSPFTGGWKVMARKRPEIALEEWVAKKQERYAALPAWVKEVKSIPSLRTLQEWEDDGRCETPTGHVVEPDGHGPDGVPSWLLALGMI